MENIIFCSLADIYAALNY